MLQPLKVVTRIAASGLLLSALCCRPNDVVSSASHPPSTGSSDERHCHYQVQPHSTAPLVLDVSARCNQPPAAFGAAGWALESFTVLPRDGTEALPRRGRRFLNPRGATTVEYRVDLDRVAIREGALDGALRSGRSLITPAATWLLQPLPARRQNTVSVTFEPTAELDVALALRSDGERHVLREPEVRVASYSVLGKFDDHRLSLPRPGRSPAQLRVAILDGNFELDRKVLLAWIERASNLVGDFYGGFPAEQTLIALVPVPGKDEVVSGKVLPQSAPAIALALGAAADRETLANDWVLVHELFHLGFPSFFREGVWLDEGLATYFEPVIRVRANTFSERQLWQELLTHVERVNRAIEADGLEATSDVRAQYWGGALLCLLADVEARRSSGGRIGLEHAVRLVHARGGHASRVWRLDKTIALMDQALGRPILQELARRHVTGRRRIDLDAVLGELGVRRRGEQIWLDESAPLAWIRSGILSESEARTELRRTRISRGPTARTASH